MPSLCHVTHEKGAHAVVRRLHLSDFNSGRSVSYTQKPNTLNIWKWDINFTICQPHPHQTRLYNYAF